MSKENEIELMSYTENNQKWLQCKSCYEYKKVDEDVRAVTCSRCTMIGTLKRKPMDEFFAKRHNKTGRPAGWHFMSEYKGKEQPKLKGTLKPTKVKPQKKRKKLTADQKLFKRAASWKKRLKAKRGNK